MAMRILFCVENVSVRKAIAQVLPKERMEVVPVSNAELARYLLDMVHPDLVLAVDAPPGQSAFELNEYIRENRQYRHIPVVVIVASGAAFDHNAGLLPLLETVDTLFQDKGENRTVFLSSESLFPPAALAEDSAASDITTPIEADASGSGASEPANRQPQTRLAHEDKSLVIISPNEALTARWRLRSRARRVKWAVIAAGLLLAAGLVASQAKHFGQGPPGETMTTEESTLEPFVPEQPAPDVANNTDLQSEAAVPGEPPLETV